MRAAFFGYSWSPSGKLDSYASELVRAMCRAGLDVDVYLSNQFSERLGIKGFSASVSQTRLVAAIRQGDYAFALSMNNGLLLPSVVEALDCRPVSVIVDGVHHLFDATDTEHRKVFDLDVTFAPIFTAIEPDIRSINPRAEIVFRPPATDLRSGVAKPGAVRREEISWVASLVGDHLLDAGLRELFSDAACFAAVLQVLACIEATGYIQRDEPLRGAADALARRLNWDLDHFEMQMQNVVTNNQRLAIVDRLAPLGLALYGNERWTRLLPDSRSVAHSLKPAVLVSSHADLMTIYNGSRISVNLPQIHVATALQYRVFDIMASTSLLITKHHPDSDLYRVFGSDSRIPTYRDIDELQALCAHYLAHEDERAELSSYCNALIESGFSFEDRMGEYLTMSNPEAARSLQGSREGEGSMTLRQVGEFTSWVRSAV